MNNITKGTILSVSSNADVFARGERYYREGKLLSVQSEAQGDAIIIRATVEGNYKHYDVELWLDAQNNLIKYSCNCESHNIWRGACKHVVTAMFSLSEGNFNTQKTSGLQKNVKTLTDSIEKLILKEIDEGLIITQAPAEPVRLAPCFHYEKFAEAHVTFAVGYKRMYVIKNIEAFVTSVNKEETVKYGNGLSFCHHINSFDSQSRRIIKFLQNEEEAFRDFIKRVQKNYSSVYGTSASSSRSLTLTERNLDDFFELFDGETIDGEIDGSVKIKFETKTPEFKLNVRCTENQAAVSATPFNLRVLNGRLFQYYVSKESICRMKKNDGLILLQMVKALADARGAEILFTENERSRFFSVILPKFRGLGIVASIEGEEPDVAACQVQTKLFFDSENKNVICRCVFHYGENEINPLESAGYGFLRDSAEEYRITRMLTFYGFAPEYEKQIYKLISNDAIYGFLKEGIEHLKKYAEIYVTDALKAKTIKSQYGSVGIRLQGELLNIELDDSDFTLSELIEAMESYQAKKKYHRLKDGRFLNLESEHVQSVAELLSAMDVTKKEISGNGLNLPAYRALYLDGLVKESGASGLFSFDTQLGNLIGCFNENSKLAFDIPPVLVPVLREYQKTGYQWLKMLAHYGFGGILADDMGLGKTVQVIAVLLSGQKRGAKSLVVVPTSLLYNWQNEIQKFAPQLRTAVISGVPEKRKEILGSTKTDIFITTYDTMKRDIFNYQDMTFEFLIADEAQYIKNPNTQNSKAIKDIKAKTKYALTGTPIENALIELWSIFDFIMPGYLHSSHKFAKLYEYPIVKDDDKKQAERLRRQIAPFILRRIKRNVLTELPDKTETMLIAELLPEQRKVYMANFLKARGELNQMEIGDAANRMKILAQLTRLRQICCHPGLFLENYRSGSGKLDLAVETAHMVIESGHRILLFSQFTSMLEIIKKELEGQNISYFYLEGATQAHNRIEMMDRFNSGERDVFLISLKAGGTGLNLVGADVVIHYDPWWNPSVMDQASDRAHRYGQEKAVQIFNIVAKDTIEEKIMALQEKKRNLIDTVIREGGSFINALSEEEIRSLFSS